MLHIHRPSPRWRLLTTASCLLVLGGCASFVPGQGFGEIEQTTRERTGLKAQWHTDDDAQARAKDEVTKLLSQTLSVDDAVQVALLNNRGLQAAYAELGIAQADRIQAGRLPNPGFSFGRLRRGDEVEFERGLHVNLARLLSAPIVSGIEARRFEQVQRMATLETLALVANVRKAWYGTVAAGESVRYMRQVLKAAEAGEDLASRLAKAGNWNKIDHAREQGFYADAALNLARASQAEVIARERLTRLMGLWGEQTRFSLPDRLPDLPPSPTEQPDIEQTAMAQRLDVQALRAQSEGLARNLGLNKVTRFINVLELGGVSNSSNEAPTQRGYEITLEIPLFDWGGARVAKAEALYMQSLHRLAQTAVEARSEVRQSYLGYRTSFDIARHYRDEIVPTRKRISDENLLRYNGMFISVFDLLADARSQVMAVNGYIDALRDFWLAQADLDMAMAGQPSPDTYMGVRAASDAATTAGH